jgi:hypothetical protein
VTVLLCTTSAFAQQPPPLDRLPKDTLLFVAWNGMGTLDKGRVNNSLLRLWDDPEFATVRDVVVERVLREEKSPLDQVKTRKMMSDLFLLAGNPFIFGIAGMPDTKALLAPTGANAPAKPVGAFLIYDATGKTDLHRAWLKEVSAGAKVKPTVSTFVHSGVTVTREDGPRSSDFSAYVESYFILTDSKPVAEQLITRLQGVAPADSIVSTAAYQATRAHRPADAVLEVFLRVPDFTQMEMPPASGVNTAAMLKALRLERIHGVTGSVSLASDGTRMRAAVMGDTSPGGLFDIMGSGTAEFRTLAAAPAGASFTGMRYDLLSFYQTLRNALRAGMPPEQLNNIDLVEGTVGTQLGIPLPELLRAVSGEAAVISLDRVSPGGISPLDDMYALAVERPAEALNLLRMMLGSNITNETQEGKTTFLALTLPYRDPKTGTERKRFHYLAATETMLLLAPRKAQLREAIARVAAGVAPAGSLAADPEFQRVRGRLPAALSSLTYTDFTKLPWDTIIEESVRQLRDSRSKDKNQELTAAEQDAIKTLPKILAKYLRTAYGGWWKERNGMFLESFIE